MKETTNKPISYFTLKVYENEKDRLQGIVKKEVKVKNKMTNASLAVITGLVGNVDTQTAFGYLALGTDSTAVSASHTTLQAELTTLGLGRAAATVSRTTTTQTNDTLSFTYASWTATGSTTIEEAGIFNDATTGVMLARALTTSIPVTTGNKIDLTYTWQMVGN